MRLLLVGHGRMGRLVEALAPEYGCAIASVVDSRGGARAIEALDPASLDLAIDFSSPAAVPENLPALARRGFSAVVGTTGWQAHEPALRSLCEGAGVAVLAAANFSLGMGLFRLLAEQAGRLFAPHAAFGAYIHEAHHAAKKDAPSGTALALAAALREAGYPRPVDVSATRAGSIPGTHELGFDAPSETLTLTHVVRDRAVFARGAVEAARFLRGRRGWFTLRDLVEARIKEVVP
jgi:4-hydroxy-tetrahydrodipicolinate reductase